MYWLHDNIDLSYIYSQGISIIYVYKFTRFMQVLTSTEKNFTQALFFL